MSRAAVSFALALAASVALAPLAQAQDAEAIATAAALRDRALEGSGAYEIVEEITTRFGPRPAGSPAEQAAAPTAGSRARRRSSRPSRICWTPRRAR